MGDHAPLHLRRFTRRAWMAGAAVMAAGVAATAAGCHRDGRSAASLAPRSGGSAPSPSARPLYFPPPGDAWATITPHDAGWDSKALDAALSWAGDRNTTAVVILSGGRILAERYWAAGSPRLAADVASAQKSVTSLLVGLAQEQGLVSIADPVSKHLGRGWSRAPSAKEDLITLRHLLTMTSGLTDRLEYAADAGNTWYYNNAAYHQLKRAIERASHRSIDDLTTSAISGRVGFDAVTWRSRPTMQLPDGSPMSALLMSARDMARFGLLALAGATWGGQPVLTDRSYFADSIAPSQSLNPSYGYLWWLNGQASHMLPGPNPPLDQGPLVPAAPADMYAAMGAGDNRIYVAPGLALVVVRQGSSASDPSAAARSPFDNGFWSRLMKAAPGH